MNNILLCKLEEFITEENRFGHRQHLELPSNIVTTAKYLDSKYDLELQLINKNNQPDYSKCKIVVQWVSLADGLNHSLEVFKQSKEQGCINILMIFDDWEKVSSQILQDFDYIDYAVRGLDREVNLDKLLSSIFQNSPIPEKGIVYRNSDNYVIDGGTLTHMDTLEHLKSAKSYISDLINKHEFGTYLIRVSSGCPYACTFCHIGLRANRFRKVEDVLDEISILPENITIQLASSDILQNPSWVKDFSEKILKTGKKYTFETDIRIDKAKDIDLLKLMKQAGFDQLAIGIESFDEVVSKSMKKGYTYEKIQKGFKLLLEAGLSPAINFMVGHYLDSAKTLERTAQEILKLDSRVNLVGFQYLRPLPGTRIETESLSENMLAYPLNYRDFVNSRREPTMPTKYLTKKDLKQWMEYFNYIKIDKKTNKYYFSKEFKNCGYDTSLSNKVISIAPHPISLYKNNLKDLLENDINFITSKEFYQENYDENKLNILLRHDIDFRPSKIDLLCDVEFDLGLKSDIYVILSDDYYDIKPYIEKLKKLHQKGFVLGLHTLAPGEKNYKEIFNKEILLFESYFGFKPEYFTIHGKCPSPLNWDTVKNDFLQYTKENWESLPFKGSHNIKRPYDWVEDISINGGEYSVLRRKFIEIPKNYYYGVVGILTHPIHWDVNDIAWEIDNHNFKDILK